MSQCSSRSRECSRRVAAWVVALGVLQLMASAPVHACTCIDLPGILWPLADSSVSADTAIVAKVPARGGYEVVLRAHDGTEIALEQVERLPQTFQCDEDIVFLKPNPELRPGMNYEVGVKLVPSDAQLVKFATREKSPRPKAAATPEVTYLLVGQHPDCGPGQCNEIAEVRVELAHVLHEQTWLQIRSGATRSQVNRWMFSPHWLRAPDDIAFPNVEREDPERVARLSVALPADDPCLDIALYGIDGLPLYEERRCEPDRCAVNKQRWSSTCGEPPSPGLEPLKLSPTSCDDPPVLDDPPFEYPAFDAGTPEADDNNDDKEVRLRKKLAPDCHAAPPSATAARSPLALLAFASLLLLRRRRRAQNAPARLLRRSARPKA